MSHYEFTVDGPPVGKGRPRAFVRCGKARVRTPDDTRAYEETVRQIASLALPKSVLAGPLVVDVLAVYARPGRLRRRRDPEGLIWVDAARKPDWDNVGKIICDALSPFLVDDAQICAGRVLKAYAEMRGRPRVVVRVSTEPGGSVVEVWEGADSAGCVLSV